MINEESSNLELLKQEYDVFRKKYNLPDFSELNKLFDVEEIDVDTDFLLRRFRRVISEKIASYLRFTEVILNPSNAPMFFFKLIKKLDEDDKKILSEIYEILGKVEVDTIHLDLEYFEQKEAKFILEIYNLFNKLSKDFLKIVEKLGNGENKKRESESSYCG